MWRRMWPGTVLSKNQTTTNQEENGSSTVQERSGELLPRPQFCRTHTVLGKALCSSQVQLMRMSLLQITRYCLLLLPTKHWNYPLQASMKTCFCLMRLVIVTVHNLNSWEFYLGLLRLLILLRVTLNPRRIICLRLWTKLAIAWDCNLLSYRLHSPRFHGL